MNDDEGCLVALLAGIIGMLGIVPAILIDGFTLAVLWNWFIPRIFDFMPVLGIGEALGLSLVSSAFIGRGATSDDDDEDIIDVIVAATVGAIFRLVVLLGMGGIIFAFTY